MAKLIVDGVGKTFRTELLETIALKGVSLTVEDGEFVAIMGPSGCGKYNFRFRNVLANKLSFADW